MKLESKISRINSPNERIFNFLTNFNNFKNIIPEGRVEDWKSSEDYCEFRINPIGKTGIRILEKEPSTLIKYTNLEDSKLNFFLWIQLKPDADASTYVKLTMDIIMNPMLEMVARNPLQEFLDKLAEQLSRYTF